MQYLTCPSSVNYPHPLQHFCCLFGAIHSEWDQLESQNGLNSKFPGDKWLWPLQITFWPFLFLLLRVVYFFINSIYYWLAILFFWHLIISVSYMIQVLSPCLKHSWKFFSQSLSPGFTLLTFFFAMQKPFFFSNFI